MKVETACLTKNMIDDCAALMRDDRNTIAANISEAWEDLSGAIDAKERELVAQSRAKTAALIEMNETVQRYFLSTEKLYEARTAIAR